MESWLLRNVGFYSSFLSFYVLRDLFWYELSKMAIQIFPSKMKNSAEVMRHLTHAPWTNPAFGKNGWIKHQNDLTGDLPRKAPWLPILLAVLYWVNNSFTASLISHLQLSYISLMWDDWLAQLRNLTYHMHSILLDQFHRRFSVFSQLCLSNTIVELTVTFLEIVFN